MKKLTKEETRWQIDQLRKDKLIYAIESAAITLIAIFLFQSLWVVFPSLALFPQTVVGIMVAVAVGFWLYTGIGNLMRLKKIKKLEKSL